MLVDRYVYVIRQCQPGAPVYKIGASNNPMRRIKTLQTSNPYPLRLVVMFEGDESLEKQLHERYANRRLQGEWFALTEQEALGLCDPLGGPLIPSGEGSPSECLTALPDVESTPKTATDPKVPAKSTGLFFELMEEVERERTEVPDDIIHRLNRLMEQEPLLGDHGLGMYGDSSDPRHLRMARLKRSREDLKASVWDVAWTMGWLEEHITPTKSFNHNHTSYGLKYLAESFHPRGYISNGALIAAAILSGYAHETFNGCRNVYFNMSQHSIDAANAQTSAH